MLPDQIKVIVAVPEEPRKVNTLEDEMVLIPQNATTITQPVFAQHSGPSHCLNRKVVGSTSKPGYGISIWTGQKWRWQKIWIDLFIYVKLIMFIGVIGFPLNIWFYLCYCFSVDIICISVLFIQISVMFYVVGNVLRCMEHISNTKRRTELLLMLFCNRR